MERVQLYSFAYFCSVFPTQFFENTIFSPIKCPWPTVENHLTIYMIVYVLAFLVYAILFCSSMCLSFCQYHTIFFTFSCYKFITDEEGFLFLTTNAEQNYCLLFPTWNKLLKGCGMVETVPYSFDSYNITSYINLVIRKYESSNFVLFQQCFGYSESLEIPYDF